MTIIDTEALISRQNFTDFIEERDEKVIADLLKDYPKRTINIIYPQLTPSSVGLWEAVSNLSGNQKAYIFWFIANEREDIFKTVRYLNRAFNNYCGIFVIKCCLNGNKMEFNPIIVPEIPVKQVKNTKTPAKRFQEEYWQKYFEICDELQSEMQVAPAPRHYQYIPMGEKGVQIMQTINTRLNYVATELFINSDKDLFKYLEINKNKIEEALGKLEWQELPGKKSARIRKILTYDISNPSILDIAIKNHIKTAEDFRKVFREIL